MNKKKVIFATIISAFFLPIVCMEADQDNQNNNFSDNIYLDATLKRAAMARTAKRRRKALQTAICIHIFLEIKETVDEYIASWYRNNSNETHGDNSESIEYLLP